MGRPSLQLVGHRFGRYEVLAFARRDSRGKGYWLCRCTCGVQKEVRDDALRRKSATTLSCGCLSREQSSAGNRTHGMTETPEYQAYSQARDRCTNRKNVRWKHYGGRGIKFLFDSFEQFFAELGARPSPELSLDRRNNDGHYEPGNIRWATDVEQNNNRRKPKRMAR